MAKAGLYAVLLEGPEPRWCDFDSYQAASPAPQTVLQMLELWNAFSTTASSAAKSCTTRAVNNEFFLCTFNKENIAYTALRLGFEIAKKRTMWSSSK